MHGAKAQTVIACKSDEDVLQGLQQVIPGHDFTFGRFTALADVLGCWFFLNLFMLTGTEIFSLGTTPRVSPDSIVPIPNTVPLEIPLSSITPVLNMLNTQLKTLYESLPSRTAFLIFTGHSDPRRMSTLNARKTAFETSLKSGKTPEEIGKEMWWTTADGRELEEEVERAKQGLLFLAIKS